MIEELKRPAHGCVLLDLLLADENGMEVCQQLRTIAPYLPVILVTGNGSISARYEGMRCGVVGFIDKPYEPMSLHKTILAAAEIGKEWWQTHLFRESVSQLPEPRKTIVQMMMRGASEQEVGALLSTSQVRLQSHLSGAFEQLGISTVQELRDAWEMGPGTR